MLSQCSCCLAVPQFASQTSSALQTASLSIGVGTACTAAAPEVILEALVITAAIVMGLTVYAFHAARKGIEFSFLGPILISSKTLWLASFNFPLSRASARRGILLDASHYPQTSFTKALNLSKVSHTVSPLMNFKKVTNPGKVSQYVSLFFLNVNSR